MGCAERLCIPKNMLYMTKQVVNIPSSPSPRLPQNGKPIGMLLLLVALAVFILMGQKDFIVWKDGKPELAPWRKAKLEKELEEIDNAEQYVLLADVDGWYECFNCYGKPQIFLFEGQVWKYGVTTKGEKGRYTSGLPSKNLLYLVEYEGPVNECLKQEKIKIYNYVLLPENLKRERPLKRPPGNKRDN